MRELITRRHEPRLSSLPGASVFRRRNTGTHPNTHCCHAVLDVLFICWIPARSHSHALPMALSLPPSRPPPFLLPVIDRSTLRSPLGTRRLLGSEPYPPCHLFFGHRAPYRFFSSTHFPQCLSFFHPRLLFHGPLFPLWASIPLFTVPLPSLLSLSLSLSPCPAFSSSPCPSQAVHVHPVFAQRGSAEITTLDLAPRLRAEGASSPRGKPGVAYPARAHTVKARSDAALSRP